MINIKQTKIIALQKQLDEVEHIIKTLHMESPDFYGEFFEVHTRHRASQISSHKVIIEGGLSQELYAHLTIIVHRRIKHIKELMENVEKG